MNRSFSSLTLLFWLWSATAQAQDVDVTVENDTSDGDIVQELEERIAPIRACAQSATTGTIDAVIESQEGRVVDVELGDSMSEELRNCMANEIRQWNFRSVSGFYWIRVTYEFSAVAGDGSDREAADDAGIFGAMDQEGAEAGSSNTDVDIGGPVGTQHGSYGYGTRGTGSGGGGTSVTGVGQGNRGPTGPPPGDNSHMGPERRPGGNGGGGQDGQRTGQGDGRSGRTDRTTAAVADDAYVIGNYPREWVFEVIQNNLNKFSYCYTRQLQRDPHLEGDISIMFVISSDGRVRSANTASTTMNNAEVESCCNTQMLSLRFPAHPGGAGHSAVVTYPFTFSLPDE